MTLITASLLCGASVPALSQQAQTESCARLQVLAEQNRERFQPAWTEAALVVIRQADAANCQRYVLEAERGIRQLDARAAQQGNQLQGGQAQQAEGSNIVVTQPQPQVTVQQDAPQVSVTQPQPQVTVNQRQPQIIVRQAQPTVRVQMPQPVITIDQPQPEIIVRMPEPEVAVTTPEPVVNVTQAEPQVQVTQAEPQVQVQMEQPDIAVQGSQQAQVTLERDQPVVQVERQGEAEVNVNRAQPQVSYEAAEPKVEVQQMGEPRIEFSQSGEPRIRMEQMGQEGQQQAGAQQGMANQQQAANSAAEGEPTGSIAPRRLSDQDRQRIGIADANEQPGPANAVQVSEIINNTVVNRQGENLGTVQSVVKRGNRDYVVISHGGFLGFGESTVAIPVQRITVAQQGRIVVRGLSEEELDELVSFDMSSAQALGASDTINITRTQ